MNDAPWILSEEVESIKRAYDALNRGDVPAFLTLFSKDVERTEPEGFHGSGTYVGLDQLEVHTRLHRGKWEAGASTPTQFHIANNRVVVLVHVRVKLSRESEWREGDIADGFAFREGKATCFRTFVDRSQALEWAGITTAKSH